MDNFKKLHMTVYASLFAALIAAGAFLAIPIGPVPIVLQNFFVMLAGLLLGWRGGLLSVAIYLLAGAVGLPVFAGGTAGIGRFAGPTGGYLIGYLPAVAIIGWVSEKGRHQVFFEIFGMILGSLLVYILGVSWLKILTGMEWAGAVKAGMLPFLPGDLIKIAAAVPVAKALRPIITDTD